MSAQNDSAFLRMFILILGALVAFTIIILILANAITGSVDEARGQDPREHAAIVERIKPVGKVNVVGAPAKVEAAAPAAPAAAASGADIAAVACNACHIAGVLGAPKLGDKAAWEQRLAAAGSVDGLTAVVITGKGGMPPRGGSTASDAELHAAVEHMLAESGVDVGAVPAPAEPAPAPAAAVGQAVQQAAEGMADAAKSMAGAMMPAPAPAPAAAPADATYDLAKGKAVYDTACFACHLAGVAGAPKLGDKALWAPRIAQGMDAMIANVINGKGAMPPRAGRVNLTDAEIADAVAYMVKQAE